MVWASGKKSNNFENVKKSSEYSRHQDSYFSAISFLNNPL